MMGRKLELPIFAREDTYGWIVRVKRYFHITGGDDEDKLDLALMAMEGEALVWFEWWETQVPCPTWQEFKEDLVQTFQPGVARNPMEPLMSVKQEGSVQQYTKEFEAVANARRDLSHEAVMGIFLYGLKQNSQPNSR